MDLPSDKGSVAQLFYGSVTLGERGQVVIPAEARKVFNMQPGDKLLVFGHPSGWGILVSKVDDLQQVLAGMQERLRAMGDGDVDTEREVRDA